MKIETLLSAYERAVAEHAIMDAHEYLDYTKDPVYKKRERQVAKLKRRIAELVRRKRERSRYDL